MSFNEGQQVWMIFSFKIFPMIYKQKCLISNGNSVLNDPSNENFIISCNDTFIFSDALQALKSLNIIEYQDICAGICEKTWFVCHPKFKENLSEL